uniref:glycylpeptide N-tetradecanoyltransferase n=1 Tax=viral metagenome TaxID=1070528 RepID=A0A6C0DZC0_9ZZZZ
MSNFWKHQPLQLSDSYEIQYIKNTNDVLDDVKRNISKSRFKIQYRVVDHEDPEVFQRIVDCINKNYQMDNLSLHYSYDLLKYWFSDDSVICIFFYTSGMENEVGFISGKVVNLIVNNKPIESFEVNFLCIARQIRNIGIATLLINTLTKEYLERCAREYTSAIYTISKDISAPCFGTIQYYHVPINLEKLSALKIINQDTKHNFCKSNEIMILHCNGKGIEKHLLLELYTRTANFNKKNYKLYEDKTLSQFTNAFENKSFHHFICFDGYRVTDYVCLYDLKTVNSKRSEEISNGYYYYGFFTKNTAQIFENICAFIREKSLLDMITMYNTYKLHQYLENVIQGNAMLNFYLFNVSMKELRPDEIGFITI